MGPKWPKYVSVNRDTASVRHSKTRAKISWGPDSYSIGFEYTEAGKV